MVSLLTTLQECRHKKERNKKVLKRDRLERLNTTDKVWQLLIILQLLINGLSLGQTKRTNV